MLSGVEAHPGEEVGGAESCEMKDSATGLEIMLCQVPPVMGLRGIKPRLQGFPSLLAGLGSAAHPEDITQVPSVSSAVQGLGRGQEELRFPRTVL